MIIRELKDPLFPGDKTIPAKIIPSAWGRRKIHEPNKIVDATLQKGKMTELKTALGTLSAYPVTWEWDGRKTIVWLGSVYPHLILAWEEPDGSKGEILASRREIYWKQNASQDLYLRKELKL